ADDDVVVRPLPGRQHADERPLAGDARERPDDAGRAGFRDPRPDHGVHVPRALRVLRGLGDREGRVRRLDPVRAPVAAGRDPPLRPAPHARQRGAGDRVNRAATTLNVMRRAFLAGYADLRAIFGRKAWLTGWMLRVIAQISFFGLIGLRVANDRSAFFLLVG